MEDNIHNYLSNDLTVIVYNFVDMLSHARTEMEVLKELAGDEVSYRSLAVSWFEHSPLFRALRKIADKGIQVHHYYRPWQCPSKNPSKGVGDRQPPPTSVTSMAVISSMRKRMCLPSATLSSQACQRPM